MSDPVIDAYRARQIVLDKAIRDALERYFMVLDFSQPEKARDELLTFIPSLVDRFGPVSAELATEYYSEARATSGATGAFTPETVNARLSDEHMEKAIRRMAGDFWSDDPSKALSLMQARTGRWVRAYGRRTVEHNVRRERVGYARVPRGMKTCSFCMVLASRGVVYTSEYNATASQQYEVREGHDVLGRKRKKIRYYSEKNKTYHDDCDCEVVRIAPGDDYPDGYLPDDIQQMYKQAVDHSGSNELKDILQSFRSLHPEMVTDGVFAK